MTSSTRPPPDETTARSPCFELASSSAAAQGDDASISVSIVLDPSAPSAGVEAAAELPDPEARRERSRRAIVGNTISDRYRIDALIAEGGMGAVYRGEHVHMRKLVAVKVLRPETEGFPELVARFEREAIAGAHVDHPNVASATDFGRMPDGAFFLVLEFVDGPTLRQRMKAGPISSFEAARIARQLAEALGACHAMGVVHRDVKPRNVMIESKSGRVKLIDFGLAKVPTRPSVAPRPVREDDDEDTHRAITLKGIVFGTVAYMAPEAELGMDAVDHRADLYALGVVMYELFTGKHPFDATGLAELFAAQKYVAPPAFRERAPDRVVSAALEAVTMRLLAKRPLDRFQSADEVAKAIDAALGAGMTAESTFDNASVSVSVPDPDAGARVSSLVTAPPVGAPSTVASGELKPRRRVGLLTAALAGALALIGSGFVRGTPAPRHVATARFAPSFEAAGGAAAERTRSRIEAASVSLSAEKLRLREAAEARAFERGAAAILALAEQDGQPALDTRDVSAAATVTLGLTFTESPRTAAVFDALENRLGADGIDVLYDIVSKHGGARAARKADEILDRPEVKARASAAVQAALALRDARCDMKPALFEHVGKDGDERALMLLERLRGANCTASRCCYLKNRPLDRTIAAMKARLGKG